MRELSVVIPTRNEAEHIQNLIERLNQVLTSNKIEYEMIVIDDHSQDSTVPLVKELASRFPITVQTKTGQMGKAFSILQGCSLAKYELIATIDADLQYPPEMLPQMVMAIAAGADVVVGDRQNGHPHLLRRISASTHRNIFIKGLHHLSFDAYSGLKVFKKEIIDRLPLKPEAWSFDLEFLIRAQQAGYSIKSLPITFVPRETKTRRKSNHQPAVMAKQMVKASVKQKLTRSPIFPFLPKDEQRLGKGFHYNGQQFITHTELEPHHSALYRLADKHIALLILLLAGIITAGVLNWHTTIVVFIACLTVLYFADLLFNLFLIIRSFSKAPEIKVSPEEIAAIKENDWPTYSILCPLYNEPEVIPQFAKAMSRLDYPQNKLQVLLLLEEDDQSTISQAKKLDLPSNFEIVVVPQSMPKTKPKACNYGLLKATGEYIVIYDAEDVPEPLQLKKAVVAFNKVDPKVICIQAKLNFYNPHQNLLTRVFTTEYSLWFDLVLTGIQSINAPVPLGGTSNHFRAKDLTSLKGWDAFNVTEDCDLGMRLVKHGYQTTILDSTTYEEANSDLVNWLKQRSRWIKGYIQTYLVHIRDLDTFVANSNPLNLVTFQLIVGGKILSLFINPLMWVLTIIYFAFRARFGLFIETLFPTPVLYMGVFSLVIGNFLYVYYYMIGSVKRGQDELVKFAFLIPFYWLAMSIASWIALYTLIKRPHHWFKTKHGLHLTNKKYQLALNT